MRLGDRPGGVTAAAVVTFMGSGITALIAAVTIFSGFQFRNASNPPTSRPAAIGPFSASVIGATIYLALTVWGVATGGGLLKVKAWARASILIFSGFIISIVVFFTVVLTLISGLLPTAAAAPSFSSVRKVLLGVAIVPVLVSAWWLVYFNLRSVKQQFEEYRTTGHYAATDGSANTLFLGPQRPLSITIIACLYLAGSLLLVESIFHPHPSILLVWTLGGSAARVIHMVYVAAGLTVGIGLLKLRPWARISAICISFFHLFNGLGYVLLPGFDQRFSKMISMAGLPPQFTAEKLMPLVYLGSVFASLLSLVVIWLLVRGEPAFAQDPAQAHSSA